MPSLKISKTLGWAFVLHCAIEKSHVTATWVDVIRHCRFFNEVWLALSDFRISDLSAYMADANTHIQFTSDIFPQMNEA